jgi:hypothetical protein
MTDRDPTFLALLVFLYAFFEFFLQRLWWKPSREAGNRGRAAVSHAALLLVVMLLGASGFLSRALVPGLAGLAIVYGLLEYLGGRGTKEKAARRSLERFVVKQATMGILLFVVWRLATPLTAHAWYTGTGSVLLDGFGPFADVLREKCTLILAVATSYLVVIDGGTRIVRGILGRFPGLYRKVLERLNAGDWRAGTADSEENVGEWIGILERVITLTFVLTGNFTAIAFVLTAKSIARFKELEQSKDFAEYYLLGTSGSMIVALGVGMMTRILFGL